MCREREERDREGQRENEIWTQKREKLMSSLIFLFACYSSKQTGKNQMLLLISIQVLKLPVCEIPLKGSKPRCATGSAVFQE